MNVSEIASSLHPLERKVVPFLSKCSLVSDLVKKSGMQEVEVLRALSWLKGKGVLDLNESVSDFVDLDVNGLKYRSEKLPERVFLEIVLTKPSSIAEIKKFNILSDEETAVSIGLLRKLGAVNVVDNNFEISAKGKVILKEGFSHELFLKKNFPLDISSLSSSEKIMLDELKKRKNLIKIVQVKTVSFSLTALGKNLVTHNISDNFIDNISPQILKSGSWKGKEFRKFDVSSPVPRIFGGRKQHYRKFIDEVREKFLSMGFVEMSGPIVETEFWDMDALYMPQFHSARDIHDAYYLKDPEYASSDELPKKIVDNVKRSHESGFNTGSLGWRYEFDLKRTFRHVLRTQDTAISPRTLSSPDLRVPGKYFQIVRCFRYDVIDATHLPDFNQTGGFVVDKGMTLRHLVSLLRLFAKEFAEADEIKVVPAYFPFTEPSASLYAKHPKIGWLELAGAGLFRPEMTRPLGVNEPVIAWGVGLERLAMFRLGLNDIRQLFSHDLEFLRTVRSL